MSCSPKSGSRSFSPSSSSTSDSSGSCKQQCSSWSKCTHAASTATGPSTISPHWSSDACPSSNLSKLDRMKPEFSGKPEEDAESHFLSTRDWMEAHNFPEGVKVRCSCLTLSGEARLCYEALATLDNDWPALQNKFRWQYSKIGNIPKQLFHAWRTFKMSDTIDSYILRISQATAMLKYREMQISENFKNTHTNFTWLWLMSTILEMLLIWLKEYWQRKSLTDSWLDNPPHHSWEWPVMTSLAYQLVTREEWLLMSWKS